VPDLGDLWRPWSTNNVNAARTPIPAHETLSPVFYRAVRLP
jgi:hypothetical protein